MSYTEFPMPTVEATIEIAQPPEVIAEALLDPENAVHWTTDLERFEIISRKPGEVGSVAHLHYVQSGRPYVMEDRLEEMVPNRYFRSTVTGGGLKAQVETWLRGKNGSTDVTVRWSGTGTSLPLRIMLPFLRSSIRRQTLTDLDKLKSLIETHGAHFSP
jgi:hypothetical protein